MSSSIRHPYYGVKLDSSARIDLATACRVSTGSGEFAISIAPRVSAPSSSRVAVSGSSTVIVPACAAAVSAVHDHRVRVLLIELGVAGQAKHRGPVDDQDALHIRLQHTVEERLEATSQLVDAI